jgi:two-component sensor histidine kinase
LVRRSFSEDVVSERADLEDLIGKIMKPHAPPKDRKAFSVRGPQVWLGEHATNGLALMLHELATNAVKYEALKSEDGVVDLSWQIGDGCLTIDWCERGGPQIACPPEITGFGTRLSQATIVGQFAGELRYDWRPEGLAVRMTLPVQNLAR